MLRSATFSIVVIWLALVSDVQAQTGQPLFSGPPVAWETLPKGNLWANYCIECGGAGCVQCGHHKGCNGGCSDCGFSCLGILSGRCPLLDLLLGRNSSCNSCDSCSGGSNSTDQPAPANTTPNSNQENKATPSPSDVPRNTVPKQETARTQQNRAAPAPPNVVVETDAAPVPPAPTNLTVAPENAPTTVQLAPANPIEVGDDNAEPNTQDDPAPMPLIVPPVKVEAAEPKKDETTKPVAPEKDEAGAEDEDVPRAEIPQNEIPPNQIPDSDDDSTPGNGSATMVRKPTIKRVSAEIIQSPRPLSHWIKL